MQLEAVDWDFTSRAAEEIEALHPYPAKFIPEIPRTLIRNLPFPVEGSVFDPFCGSGTTLVEAQRAGHHAVGVDLNPIACLITRVKTSPLPSGMVEAAAALTESARCDGSPELPEIPNVDHWFKLDVQVAVGAIARRIASEPYAVWRDQLRLCLSSILVRVSNQESDTRYAAVEKSVSAEDVFGLFQNAAIRLQRALAARDWPLWPTPVLERDTLDLTAADIPARVGLVVTSPPYPNAYEYWLYHKYRMWWLGHDPIAVKQKEIGARAHFFKKNHHTAEHFVEQMRKTFRLISSVLLPGGFVCFVVGRSRIHGKIVDNAAIIDRVARECSLEPVGNFERVIRPDRKSFNLSHANIKLESVLIFKS